MSSPDLIVSQDRCGDVTLPVNPFVSNRYHFGMLLGVADLESDQAYHRGKSWLHNAWLHGIGVVWGLDVEVHADRNEVDVGPGLAIDDHGRELLVTERMCVDLGAWFAERRPDDLVVDQLDGGDVGFTVHVELCHDSCLDRPVPSIAEPCEDASLDTAYSRAVERGLPRLTAPRPDPAEQYPRLRQFFGHAEATDDLVTDALADVATADAADRAMVCVGWLRRLAAADVTALQPEAGAPSWSPWAGDGCVPLAEIRARLRPDGDAFVVVPDGEGVDGTTVDALIRPAHVRTRTTQELLCHGHGAAPAAAGELRAVAGSATAEDAQVRIEFTVAVEPTTITTDSFTVSVLGEEGWSESTIDSADLAQDGVTVTLELAEAPSARPLRIVARGTGPSPILSVDGAVLSGVEGDPPLPSGSDAALMITGPETPEED